MGRPERPLNGAQGPIAAFACDLRALRKRAGNPSYRELARTALFAPSVLSGAASGYRLPTLPVTLAFVAACGDDWAVWEQRWREVAAEVAAGTEPARGASRRSATFPRPRQLPIGSPVFVGRTRALHNATRVIGRSGPAKVPIVVSGPIGVGKTTFALRLADEVAAEFPDGQLCADLDAGDHESRSPQRIVRGFLRALGVPAPLVPDDTAQRVGLCRSLLAERRLFVLLENVQDERQVRPFLSRASHSQVVVTSRARLLGLEGTHRVDLDIFTRNESLMLIGQLVGTDRVQAEYEAIDGLAELCGDLPLAVNIIGRMIAARPEWAVAHTAGLLADRDRLMVSLCVGDVNVRDRFASAYERLSPGARSAIDHLGSGGGRWTTAIGLAAATGTTIHAADDVLESLVDTGLLTKTNVGGRYRVPSMVGVFVASLRGDAARMTAAPAA